MGEKMMRKVGLKLRAMVGGWYRENQLQLLSLLERNPNAKVLDIGCSSGEFTLEVGKTIGTKELHGIDINKEAVKCARKKRIKAITHDANTKLPYKDGFFDVVVSNQVLEHRWRFSRGEEGSEKGRLRGDLHGEPDLAPQSRVHELGPDASRSSRE
jgi:ubiquinone/menaquinone biosynthesis C-methylase UbiE